MFLSLNVNADSSYIFHIDIANVDNDKVDVEAICPVITEDTVNYCMPKIVPGTYSIYDFGRFIEDFNAYDKEGNKLIVTVEDVNTWTIRNAKNLHRITYKVNDSFDAFDTDTPIFEPAGSNIQVDTNYLINTFAYVGYFEDRGHLPYELRISHQPDFYGGSALNDQDLSSTTDLFILLNYHEVADNPIMYCRPDTASVMVANTQVLISLYSPNKVVSAKFLAGKMDTLLQAQGKYLGGKLPVDKYAFIIYLTDKEGVSGGQGALEHSYSSVYYMPEMPSEQFTEIFRDFASHEFFHVITPLSIHSNEIQFFDFNNPQMSKHLWLYEGSTEYHAHHVQVKYNLISRDEYLDVIRQKINVSRLYYIDTLPFTIMSKECLGAYKQQYFNVYMKGALISMCLDLMLLNLSNGDYNIQKLIAVLSNYYGKGRPFSDDELFDKIAEISGYPEVRIFFADYVEGNNSIPYEEFLGLAGVQFTPVVSKKEFSFGGISMSMNPENRRLVIVSTNGMNDFGRKIGYKPEDEIISINKVNITVDNINDFKNNWMSTVKENDPYQVVVLRTRSNGKQKKTTLKTKVFKAEVSEYNVLSFSENPSSSQLKICEAWLNP